MATEDRAPLPSIDLGPLPTSPSAPNEPLSPLRTGYGPRANESHATLPPPRPLAGDPLVRPSGPMAPDINPITSRMSALGSLIEYRLQRTGPRDLPAGEMGWSPWFKIQRTRPSSDDVEDEIRERYGGGEYEVQVRSQDRQRPQLDSFRIMLQGPWKPQTAEGRVEWHARYPQGNGGQPQQQSMPGYDPGAAPVLTVARDAMALAQGQLAQASAERTRVRESENGALAQILPALLNRPDREPAQRPPTDMAGVIASVTPLVLGFLEHSRSQREAERAEAKAREEAAQRRHEQMLEMLRNQASQAQSPAHVIEGTKAMFDIVRNSAQQESSLRGELLKAVVTREMAALGLKQPSEGLMGWLGPMLQGVGPDVVRMFLAAMAPKIAAMQAQPQPGQPPPALPAQATVAPPPPSPTAVAQTPQPPVAPAPIPAGSTIWQNGQHAEPQAQAQQPAGPTLAEQGEMVSLRAMEQVLSVMAAMIGSGAMPDAVQVWQHRVDGRSTFEAWLMAPLPFRECMKAEQTKPAPSFVAMVQAAGQKAEVLMPLAQQIDQATQVAGTAAYAKSLLDQQPWALEPVS